MCHHGNLKYVQEGFSGSTKNYFHHVFFNKRRGVSCEFSDVMFCINNSCIFACCWEKKEIACSANTPSCSFLLLPFILSQFLGGFRSTLSQPGPFQFLPSFPPSCPSPALLTSFSPPPPPFLSCENSECKHSHTQHVAQPAWSQQNIYENLHLNWCHTGSQNKRGNK